MSPNLLVENGTDSRNEFENVGLTGEQWERIAPLMPRVGAKVGRPHADHRTVMEGIVYRYRTGIPWRDLPREPFAPWQTVWKRHHRFTIDGTWDQIWSALLAEADAAGQIDWEVSVDSTINRAHQHATNTTRPEQGRSESQEPHP
ncbi:IS5 family transposase [Cellulomonas sp. JH27-2]|nr:IS5 family transposase [Cellulomonas sp. JH27-2]